MMISTDLATLAPPLAALGGGVVSAVLYSLRRRWVDALLAALAGVALAATLADVRLPAATRPLQVATDAGHIGDADRMAIPAASAIMLSGDGAREAEWRDLPARPLQWKPAEADLLRLDFPRSISLGRIFTLAVHRSPAPGAWRLQLLAENKQVLADSGLLTAAFATVRWLPPVAESMVLQARLLDAQGQVLAQGPVPLQVTEPVPLQIQGRFDAPSFDARTLNQLLSDGSAILDWHVALGKAIARSETPRAELNAPNAMFVDAAYVEHLAPAARAALLTQTAKGVPLIVLGGNAADAGVWQRDFGLRLLPQSATTESEDMRRFSQVLALPPAALNPADDVAAPWAVLARDDRQRPWLWQRTVGQGRVVWIGVADWHKYAISAAQPLALWWQAAMDKMALASEQQSAWRLSDPMPVPGLRSEVCAQGVKPGTKLTAAGYAAMTLWPRADKADGVCAAYWPREAGWVRFEAEGMPSPGATYVYAPGDWPLWQKALRRDATAQYAARARAGAALDADVAETSRWKGTRTAGALFALTMLMLWWREQRLAPNARASA